jgi:hypothetical protein
MTRGYMDLLRTIEVSEVSSLCLTESRLHGFCVDQAEMFSCHGSGCTDSRSILQEEEEEEEEEEKKKKREFNYA